MLDKLPRNLTVIVGDRATLNAPHSRALYTRYTLGEHERRRDARRRGIKLIDHYTIHVWEAALTRYVDPYGDDLFEMTSVRPPKFIDGSESAIAAQRFVLDLLPGDLARELVPEACRNFGIDLPREMC